MDYSSWPSFHLMGRDAYLGRDCLESTRKFGLPSPHLEDLSLPCKHEISVKFSDYHA